MNSQNPHKNIKEDEKGKSVLGVFVHSFFVIPFLIAVFSVLLFASIRILTMEAKTVYDFLGDVKTGSLTKRWQSAFELSKILANPRLVPNEERFDQELIRAFDQAKYDDNRVRQYLALAMARTGKEKFTEPLLAALKLAYRTGREEKEENLYALIYSLGILKARQAVPALSSYLEHPDPKIRLVTVIALGNIGDPSAAPLLKKTLSDAEPNVQWDTAISLAKLGDASGQGILLNLLDRRYLTRFREVDLEEQTHVLLVALEAAGRLPAGQAGLRDPQLTEAIERLARSDQNMNVRKLAMKVTHE